MATIELSKLNDEDFVVHFGGRQKEIDAITLGNALVGIAETLQSINAILNPGNELEVVMEATGEGSFRARLHAISKPLHSILSRGRIENIILSIFASWLYTQTLDPPPNIVINTNEVIIESGGNRIVVPRQAYDQARKIGSVPTVSRAFGKTIDALERDPAVTSFGLTPSLSDRKPLIEFSRAEFVIMRTNMNPHLAGSERVEDRQVLLTVHKAVLERSRRKWEFIWEGFRISAPILDESFFDRLQRREIAIIQGDVFDAVLRIHQSRDEMSGAWLNTKYAVIRIGERRGIRSEQARFDGIP